MRIPQRFLETPMNRGDMDQVLSDGLNMAVHFLEKSREFFPFAVVKPKKVNSGMNVSMENERPQTNQVIDLLRASLRASAARKEITCAAILSDVKFSDVKTGAKSDAIRAETDGANDASVTCYSPTGLSARGSRLTRL